jgi:hypothetical protein
MLHPLAPEEPGPDQPEGRIVAEAFRVVDVLVPRQAAVDRLPDPVSRREPLELHFECGIERKLDEVPVGEAIGVIETPA